MKYTVINTFVDLQDGNYLYRVGDKYPHGNKKVSAERLEELASGNNKIRQPLIKAVKEKIAEEKVVDEKVVEKLLDEADETVEEPKTEKPKRKGRPPKAKATKED